MTDLGGALRMTDLGGALRMTELEVGVGVGGYIGDWPSTMEMPGGGVKTKSEGATGAFSSIPVNVKPVVAPSISSIFML
jgi:hypothetical protein